MQLKGGELHLLERCHLGGSGTVRVLSIGWEDAPRARDRKMQWRIVWIQPPRRKKRDSNNQAHVILVPEPEKGQKYPHAIVGCG